MRNVVGCAVAAVLLATGSPALADEVSTYDGTDRKLYVRQVRSDVSTASAQWDKKGGAANAFEGAVYRDVVYRGDVAISDQRFVELLERAGVGADVVRKHKTGVDLAGKVGLVGLGLTGVCGVMFATNAGVQSARDVGAFTIALTSGTVGLLALAAAGGGAVARHFTTEEAVDAVHEYNKKVDAK